MRNERTAVAPRGSAAAQRRTSKGLCTFYQGSMTCGTTTVVPASGSSAQYTLKTACANVQKQWEDALRKAGHLA